MNIRPEDLKTIRDMGYTETEARFLYLVATHSGYFTRRHFLAFTDQANGCLIQRLLDRTVSRRHAREIEFGRKVHIYNLYTRPLYRDIGKENLRNRRWQSNELIHTRLLILDFVLAHLDEEFLETEADKVAYFHESLSLPLPVLPGRIYRGLKSVANTKRYFVDRHLIFIPRQGNSFSLPPLVTFTYCDTAHQTLLGYATHLRNYEKFLGRLPDFNFIYASPDPGKFTRARSFFERMFGDTGRVDGRRLLHYFELRLLWDGPRSGELTRADRDFLRDGLERYHGEPFESTYRKWSAEGLSMDEVRGLLGSDRPKCQRRFETYKLPERHDIFRTVASKDYRQSARDRLSIPLSTGLSTPCDC
jgi:hypothetical protein